MSKLDINIKTWETLEKEMAGITCLVCGQGFNATKEDSMEDNGWGETDVDGLTVGDNADGDSETNWKEDTVCRMLDENIDYRQWNETNEPADAMDTGVHSSYMDKRSYILDVVASEWIKAGSSVYSLETAQAFVDGFIDNFKI